LQQVFEKILQAGGQTQAMALGVAEPTQVARVAAEIGPVDILLANAGLNVP
jgi:NADP-dependent 3-hydroxy acid dehydrogenase YdfG